MELKKINTQLNVSPQIMPDDLAELLKQGFKSVICNRPNGEGADQPVFAEFEKAAKKQKLEVRYIPVVSGRVRDEDAAAFGTALDELPKPVMAFCRIGTRSDY